MPLICVVSRQMREKDVWRDDVAREVSIDDILIPCGPELDDDIGDQSLEFRVPY